jgi:hypothetical protein
MLSGRFQCSNIVRMTNDCEHPLYELKWLLAENRCDRTVQNPWWRSVSASREGRCSEPDRESQSVGLLPITFFSDLPAVGLFFKFFEQGMRFVNRLWNLWLASSATSSQTA